MGVNWRIRLGALFLAVGLLGSSALAARLERATDNVDASGACAMTCERNVTDMHLDPYPAYQPLEVCDDVCIFY